MLRDLVGVMILHLFNAFNLMKLVSYVKPVFALRPSRPWGCSLLRWPTLRRVLCSATYQPRMWCMRVLHVVVQRSLWSQDVIASLIRGRLRGGDCNLPDGGARGCACQTTHALLVGVARAYLDSLHGASAASWLDPDVLPAELRANGGQESGEEEGVAADERSRSPPDSGRLHRLPVNTETVEGVTSSGAASSHEMPRPATATESEEQEGRPAAAPEPPQPAELEGGYGDEDVDSVRDVVVAPMQQDVAEEEDTSLVQMLFMHEGEILQEAGVNRAARLHLNEFLERCASSEDVPVEWAFLSSLRPWAHNFELFKLSLPAYVLGVLRRRTSLLNRGVKLQRGCRLALSVPWLGLCPTSAKYSLHMRLCNPMLCRLSCMEDLDVLAALPAQWVFVMVLVALVRVLARMWPRVVWLVRWRVPAVLLLLLVASLVLIVRVFVTAVVDVNVT